MNGDPTHDAPKEPARMTPTVPEAPAPPDTDPQLLRLETQPVPAAATTSALATDLPAYPTLPAAYALADDSPAAGPLADGSGAPSTAPAPAAPVAGAVTVRRIRRTPRVRTVTFGLVLLAVSVLSLVSLLTDVRIDGGVVGLGLLIGAGAALLAGGIAAALREARGGPGAG